jgi:hypothetical protein
MFLLKHILFKHVLNRFATHLSVGLSATTHPSIHLSICLYICLSTIYSYVCNQLIS